MSADCACRISLEHCSLNIEHWILPEILNEQRATLNVQGIAANDSFQTKTLNIELRTPNIEVGGIIGYWKLGVGY
jgi:hypothetical protein